MKWVNHRITTFAAVATYTHGDWLAASFAAAASVLPDWLEFRLLPTASLRAKFHRTWSHWLLGYTVLTYVLSVLIVPDEYQLAVDMVKWAVVGAAAHVIEDIPCGSVAAVLPWHRVKLCPRLFKVGAVSEYVFTLMTVVMCCVIAFI